MGTRHGCVCSGECLLESFCWNLALGGDQETKGLEIRGLDGVNGQSLIRPGHESSPGSVQLIRRWGLLMGSISGSVHW